MKLGTFVGKEIIKLSDSEVKYVLDTVTTFMSENYPNTAYKLKLDESLVNGFFTIDMFDGITNYRDWDGNLVKPKYISLYMVKSRGYDEAVHGKFFDWPEGYQAPYDIESYSITVNIMGDEREYKKKTVYANTGLHKTYYTYGTELEDLELPMVIKNIMTYIMSLRKEKKNTI